MTVAPALPCTERRIGLELPVPTLPMFPLGTVLFPHMVLPLHVFEPRYRTMMRDILDGDAEFGVTLIERGHEVGGGDLRTDHGTVARLVQAEELDDGRWLVIGVGTDRFKVERWLPEDPYPRAEVRRFPERPAAPDAAVDAATATLLEDLVPLLRRVLALRSELDEPGNDPTFELAEPIEVACWQAAVLAPLTPLDAQRVLTAQDCTTRLRLLQELLVESEEALRFRLSDPTQDGR